MVNTQEITKTLKGTITRIPIFKLYSMNSIVYSANQYFM
jgi:hypothetical protein